MSNRNKFHKQHIEGKISCLNMRVREFGKEKQARSDDGMAWHGSEIMFMIFPFFDTKRRKNSLIPESKPSVLRWIVDSIKKNTCLTMTNFQLKTISV